MCLECWAAAPLLSSHNRKYLLFTWKILTNSLYFAAALQVVGCYQKLWDPLGSTIWGFPSFYCCVMRKNNSEPGFQSMQLGFPSVSLNGLVSSSPSLRRCAKLWCRFFFSFFFFFKEGNPHSHVCQEAISRSEQGRKKKRHGLTKPSCCNVLCNLWEQPISELAPASSAQCPKSFSFNTVINLINGCLRS